MFGSVASTTGRSFKLIDGTRIQVVGVAENGKYETLTEDPVAAAFLPILQFPASNTWLVVRSGADAERLAAAIKGKLRDLDPALPSFIETWENAMGLPLFPARMATAAARQTAGTRLGRGTIPRDSGQSRAGLHRVSGHAARSARPGRRRSGDVSPRPAGNVDSSATRVVARSADTAARRLTATCGESAPVLAVDRAGAPGAAIAAESTRADSTSFDRTPDSRASR